jgi:hypothetical protein
MNRRRGKAEGTGRIGAREGTKRRGRAALEEMDGGPTRAMEPGAWGWAVKAGLVCLGTRPVTGCLHRQWTP